MNKHHYYQTHCSTKLISLKLFNLKHKTKREFGNQLEEFAARTLTEKGLNIVSQNYLCKMGEIDLIARDQRDLVFIEVRYRKSESFGGSVASVNKKKQRRIILAANHYLQKHQLANKVPCRFDVFAITGTIQQLEFNWIKGAFNSY